MASSQEFSPPHFFHLLVVDDDERLRTLLSRYLKSQNFWVSTVKNTAEAREALIFFVFDLVILDVMMPEESGLSLLKDLKDSMPPVIMLTAQGDLEERIEGLALGADDYIAKPFDPRELSLRIHAVLKRTHTHANRIPFGTRHFDLRRKVLFEEDAPVSLTINELKMLELFITHLEKTLSREQIATTLGDGISLRTVDVQVNRLRQKIEPFPSQPRYLQSVRGHGYCLRSGS